MRAPWSSRCSRVPARPGNALLGTTAAALIGAFNGAAPTVATTKALMMLWLSMLAVTAASWAMKAGGPLALGQRRLSPRAVKVISLMAAALLAGLIVIDLDGTAWTGLNGRKCSVSARQAGRAHSRHPCCSPWAAA